jgi:tRNA (cytidine56-2'-O)-methyltransferase
MDAEVTVLRLGHRPGRDERMTTHVALTARALGADRVVLDTAAGDARDTATGVVDRFGGPFAVETVDSPRAYLRGVDGTVVHLTMYGLPVGEVLGDVRSTADDAGSLVVAVGAGKVPFEVYDRADYNVGVTSQPHSEVAALAVFLDRLAGGDHDREWVDADRRVVPQAEGKRVEDVD